MKYKHFWIRFRQGKSGGKISFHAPSDKYKPEIWPILGMGEMSDDELKNTIGASTSDVGISRVYCLCRQGENQKVIRLLCSRENLNDAVNNLTGKYIYDWLISDAYLNRSDVPIF